MLRISAVSLPYPTIPIPNIAFHFNQAEAAPDTKITKRDLEKPKGNIKKITHDFRFRREGEEMMPLPEHTRQPNVADSVGFDDQPSISNEAPFNAKSSFSSGHVSFSPKDGSKERSKRDDFEIKKS